MPSPSKISMHIQQAAPSAFKSKLEEAIAAGSKNSNYMPWADSDSDDEADQEADRLIAAHREKRAAEEAKEAELKAIQAEVDAEMAAIDTSVTAWLGVAGRQAALKRVMAKRDQAMGTKLSSIAEAALAAKRAQMTVAAAVLTDGDMLSVILHHFEVAFLGDVPTEAGLARYCALAPVCTQWHAAISAVTRRRCALRHASMFVDGPRPLNGFKRPTFLEITPTDELLVADNHRVSLLPLPRPLTDEEDAEAAAAAASAGGSGGSGRGGGFQFGRLAPPTNVLGLVLRTFGNGDGSGGSGPGELCACHPPSACPLPPSRFPPLPTCSAYASAPSIGLPIHSL